jgi:protein-disulfide isomerase
MEVEPRLISEYVATGKANLIYRHLIQIGDDSLVSSEAMHCGAEQGAYWRLRYELYTRQTDLYNAGNIFGGVTFIAGDIGLNTEEFGSCITSRRYQAEVEADAADSLANGVRSRPVFDVAGQRIIGGRRFEDFTAILGQ